MSVGEALSLIQQTLDDGLTFFSRGTTEAAAPPAQGDVVTALGAIGDVTRGVDPDQLLGAIEGCRVFELATALAVEPLLYSQNEEAGSSLQQTFVKVRLAALEALGSLATAMGRAQRGRVDPARFASLDTLEALLSHIAAPMTFEQVRLTTAQCIFCLVAALPQRLPANFVQAMVQCVVVEPAAVVRSAILCVLRELCHSNAGALALETQTFFKLLEVDDSTDVRVLAAEVLTFILKDQGSSSTASADPHPGVASLRRRLECYEQDTELSEAASLAFLADALADTNPAAVYSEFARQRVDRALLHAATTVMSPELIAALRHALVRAPVDLQLGTQLMANFQAFSSLLKITLDCHGMQDDSNSATFNRCGVEAAVTVATLLSQSPGCRQQLTRELHAFPMWATTLKESVLHFLNATSLEFFAHIDIIDVTNVRLNDATQVEWNDQERPHRASIHEIFSAQEKRFRDGTAFAATPPPLRIDELAEGAARRRNKVTFVLLSYAVHVTLTDDLPANQSNPAATAASNPSMRERVRAGMRDAAAESSRLDHSAAAAAAATPPPKFPTPSAARRTTGPRHRDPTTPAEKQEVAFAFDRFDSAFKLARKFSKYYAMAETRQPQYEATADGFVVRQQQLRNPWGPVVKKQQVKSWTVRDMKEGDLFYFAVPFDELNRASVECVLERSRRHSAGLKRMFVTTPQSQRGRRWLLYDLMHNVIPAVEDLLKKVHALLGDYGDDNVRFPVFLFREKEMHLGERALHCGNLVEIVDQVDFYFSQNPAELFGAPDDDRAIQRLEERLRDLASSGIQQHGAGSDDDEDGRGGHGALSSDSEGDN